jgi:predicted lipoprotein with Yx(FWY)xxD motif
MKTTTTYSALLALAAAMILVASACGGGSDSSADNSAQGATTVSSRSVDGVGPVLVDAMGAALYAADQEAGGKVVCTNMCTTIWKPLTVAGAPTASGGLGKSLAVMKRPDGSRQVTFDGRPLYRFAQDDEAGEVTGNGAKDSFGGHTFTWHVATPSGVSSSGKNSGSGGYGY